MRVLAVVARGVMMARELGQELDGLSVWEEYLGEGMEIVV